MNINTASWCPAAFTPFNVRGGTTEVRYKNGPTTDIKMVYVRCIDGVITDITFPVLYSCREFPVQFLYPCTTANLQKSTYNMYCYYTWI